MNELIWFGLGTAIGGTTVGYIAWKIFLGICLRVGQDALNQMGYDVVRRREVKPPWFAQLKPIYENGRWLR